MYDTKFIKENKFYFGIHQNEKKRELLYNTELREWKDRSPDRENIFAYPQIQQRVCVQII